jgi:hypothetical protein
MIARHADLTNVLSDAMQRTPADHTVTVAATTRRAGTLPRPPARTVMNPRLATIALAHHQKTVEASPPDETSPVQGSPRHRHRERTNHHLRAESNHHHHHHPARMTRRVIEIRMRRKTTKQTLLPLALRRLARRNRVHRATNIHIHRPSTSRLPIMMTNTRVTLKRMIRHLEATRHTEATAHRRRRTPRLTSPSRRLSTKAAHQRRTQSRADQTSSRVWVPESNQCHRQRDDHQHHHFAVSFPRRGYSQLRQARSRLCVFRSHRRARTEQ